MLKQYSPCQIQDFAGSELSTLGLGSFNRTRYIVGWVFVCVPCPQPLAARARIIFLFANPVPVTT